MEHLNEDAVLENNQPSPEPRILMECAVVYIDKYGTIFYRCSICNKMLYEQESVITHTQNHFKDLPFACHVCQQSFDCLEILIEHFNSLHSCSTTDYPKILDSDDNTFENSSAFLKIEKVHLNERLETQAVYKIDNEIISLTDDDDDHYSIIDNSNSQQGVNSKKENCEYDSVDEISLGMSSEESKTIGNQNDESLGCDEDGAEPIKTKNLLIVETGAVPNDPDKKQCSCELCPAKFKTKHNLKQHFINMHSDHKEYQCEICGKQFAQKAHVKRHVNAHKDVSEKKVHPCTKCEKSFSEKGNLIQHMRSHTGEKPYKCAVCDKAFKHSSYVRTHMNIHTGERPFKCTLCDSEFRTTGELNYHMQKHKNDKPFKCDNCDKRFYLNRDLKDHLNTHTGDRPYQCKVCNQKFRKRSTLRGHQNLHKDKSYSCDQCGRRFAQAAGLRNHVKRGRCHSILLSGHCNDNDDNSSSNLLSDDLECELQENNS